MEKGFISEHHPFARGTNRETCFEDMQFRISSGRIAMANAPDWEVFTTNTSEYAFDVNDYIDLGAEETPHWWAEGTPYKIHLHITTLIANATGANRYAKFTVHIAYAGTDEAWTETPFTAELTIPTGTPALFNTKLAIGTLTLPTHKIGMHIKCRPVRIAATGGTEYASHIFLTQVGIHAEKDSEGSRQEFIK